MSKPIGSPLRYPGGKSKALKFILPLLPPNITEYREPFIGGGSVYIAVKQLHQAKIQRYWINDLNTDLVCFWRACQSDSEQLIERVQAVKRDYKDDKDGRALYERYIGDSWEQTDFERAVRFFVMNRITFSGLVDAGGYSQQAFERRFTSSSIDRLQSIVPLLQGTHITHGDYAEVLHEDGDGVFIFLDPPYLSATQSRLYGARGELHTSFDHVRFAEQMRACPHKWLITYDDSPEVRELFSFAHIATWQFQYGMNNYKQESAAKGDELFISNYPLPTNSSITENIPVQGTFDLLD
jgi:DNA adenine methylase